jgi:nitroimidazol reductase NimA-like FMN-containing flavoprotein (pyridoxamine 5'-phosphate oxidase superfamily)
MDDAARFAITPNTKVRRQPARASYDRAVAHAILDEALWAAVGFVDGGDPFVIPMAMARDGERLLLHGASSSRIAAMLGGGARLCVTVTLVDGVVLARSAMHHSLNYRAVVILGAARELEGGAEKTAALARLVDHVLPGRAGAVRPPNEIELRATRVFALPLEEVSVKRRAGGPIDDREDLALPTWAGVVPLALRAAAPIADPLHPPCADAPAGLAAYDRAAFADLSGCAPGDPGPERR